MKEELIKEHEVMIEHLRSNRYPLGSRIEEKTDKHRELISELKRMR